MRPFLFESAARRLDETALVTQDGDRVALDDELARLELLKFDGFPDQEELRDSLATKEISQTLYISEYTVKDHLSNIFEKVGVTSRGELADYARTAIGEG